MKFIQPTIWMLLITTAMHNFATGQDIDRKSVVITYVRMPLKTLPADVSTYFVQVKPRSSGWNNSLGNVYDAEQFRFNGYYRLPDAGDADQLVETEVINDLVFDKADERTAQLSYKKDKNSPEIKYTAYYYYVTYYTPKIHYRLYTKAGKPVADGVVGGALTGFDFGSTDYNNYLSNSYALAAAWRSEKFGLMAKSERSAFESAMTGLQGYCLSFSMVPSRTGYSVRYVDEKKGRHEYDDLLQARDYFLEAVAMLGNDKIALVNKLIQPDYNRRKDTMQKAIDLWEKALSQADFDNKKARIDSKVGRHLYYNLALAYLWIDDFAKAREYAQGRKKDVGSWDKNLLSGIRDLSALIDDQAARQEANKGRRVMLADSSEYVYKDPATRQREQEERAKADLARLESEKAARADSMKRASKSAPRNAVAKKTAAPKKTTSAKPAAVAGIKE